MTWAHDFLGIAADSDERAIKRAYAQRLRQCRPDEDPQGFQQLRAAYEEALAQCATSDAFPQEAPELQPVAIESPSPPVTAALPTERTSRPSSIDERTVPVPVRATDALTEQLLDMARTGDPARLDAWLQEQPEWWSLQDKSTMGLALVTRLFERPASMPGECLDVLLRFFGLDQVGSAFDPLHLQELRIRMSIHWELQPENARALGRHVTRSSHESPDPKLATRIYRQLARPLQFLQAVAFGVPMERVSDMVRFMERLSRGRLQRLLPYVQGEQMSFWLAAADRQRMNRVRFAIGTARVVALLIALLLAMAGLFALLQDHGKDQSTWETYGTVAACMCVAASLWFVYAAWLAIDGWQGAPEKEETTYPLWRWMFIPALCAVAVGMKYDDSSLTTAANIANALLMVLAIRRFRQRGEARRASTRIPPLVWVGAVQILLAILRSGSLGTLPVAELIGLVAVGFWGADLIRHRRKSALAT